MKNEERGVRNGEQGEPTLHPRSSILNPVIHSLGLVEYQPTWDAMKEFTAGRTPDGQIPGTRDEIWLAQHPPTYTQGQAGKPDHLLHPTSIPVIRIDRGGQITYHGPGQIVAYLLLDLRRWKINVRELVRLMEQAVIDLLGEFGVAAQSRDDAPGVYVNVNPEKTSQAGGVQGARSTAPETYQADRRGGEHRATQQSGRAADFSGFTQDAKIASLGLKIKHGCCYHGLALNVDMDLTPFANINPCGQAGLRVTQCRELGITAGIEELQAQFSQNLIHGLQRHFESKQHPRQ